MMLHTNRKFMDFKSIIASTRQYNFHSHTQFCDGRADMQTMAEAAVACGMRHYGFSPHSPLPIESSCNMSQESVGDFLAEVKRIQSLPELASCRFYAAMEVDYLGEQWGPAIEYFQALPLDYRIGSVHFIPSQDGEYIDIDGSSERFTQRLKDNFRNDIEYVVHTFYAQTLSMINAGGFDIIGHFDKIAHNASASVKGIVESSFYSECIEPVLDAICSRRLTIEMNTKARTKFGFFFPSPEHLPRLMESGVQILVNSDAHYPDKINSSREEAFSILDSIIPEYEKA